MAKFPSTCSRCRGPYTKDHECPDLAIERRRNPPTCEVVQLPLHLIIHCPSCGYKHIDKGIWKTRLHKTHLCESCRFEFRPCGIPTIGVAALPAHQMGGKRPVNKK